VYNWQIPVEAFFKGNVTTPRRSVVRKEERGRKGLKRQGLHGMLTSLGGKKLNGGEALWGRENEIWIDQE